MTWFDWLVFIFCWSLPFAVWAIRRWRVRMYVSRDRNFYPTRGRPFDPARGRPVNEGMPAGAGEAEDNPQRPRLVVIERPKPFLISPSSNSPAARSGNVV